MKKTTNFFLAVTVNATVLLPAVFPLAAMSADNVAAPSAAVLPKTVAAPPLPRVETPMEAAPKSIINAAPPVLSGQATLVPSLSGETISSDIANFEVVSQGLWRGAQPSHQAINKLAQSGVKTIIDLRYAGSGCSDEAQLAKQLGINYVNIPLGFEHPSMVNIAKFLAIVAKPANQPVFVHCRQGADRTGTLVGIFRIMHDHWTFTEAYNEMRLHHFKPWLANMKALVARCEGNSKLSKELTEMANKLEESADAENVSLPQISIPKISIKTAAPALY